MKPCGQVGHIVNPYAGLVMARKERFQGAPFVIALTRVSDVQLAARREALISAPVTLSLIRIRSSLTP